MRTFQRRDGPGARFWDIEQPGARLTGAPGRVGAFGSTRTAEHPDEDSARADLERRVREKLREGYRETTPAPPAPMQQALEDAVAAHPDDLAAHMAYADWLSEQPAPALQARGELIRVQLALEDERRPADERQRLRERERVLLDERLRARTGPLAPLLEQAGAEIRQARFARGWLDSLTFPSLGVE